MKARLTPTPPAAARGFFRINGAPLQALESRREHSLNCARNVWSAAGGQMASLRHGRRNTVIEVTSVRDGKSQ
jgi:hypothetical protein